MLDVSGQTGGKISIRSGQFQIDNATLQSNTVLGDSGGIEIASSVMSMKGGSIQTSTAGPGIAGDIAVDTRTLTMSDGAFMASLAPPRSDVQEQAMGEIYVSMQPSQSQFRGFAPALPF